MIISIDQLLDELLLVEFRLTLVREQVYSAEDDTLEKLSESIASIVDTSQKTAPNVLGNCTCKSKIADSLRKNVCNFSSPY